MFENEYLMTSKKYEKYIVPKFYALPIFYVYFVIFIMGIIGYYYFNKNNIDLRWKTLSVFLIFISIYRGVFYKWMLANKQYRLMQSQYFGGESWICKYVIKDESIELYLNGKLNNVVPWDKIKKWTEAKTYFALRTENYMDAIMLEKDSFVKGNIEKFKKYMFDSHTNVPFERELFKYDR